MKASQKRDAKMTETNNYKNEPYTNEGQGLTPIESLNLRVIMTEPRSQLTRDEFEGFLQIALEELGKEEL